MADEYVVERHLRVAGPPAALYERIVDLQRWQSWSPWEDLDPNLQRAYGGADQGVGQWYEWAGNRRAGEGRMECIEVVDGEQVTFDLAFLKPFKSQSVTSFHLEPDGDGTTVTWRMRGPRTLMLRVMGLFTSMDKMVGPDFEKGLDRLRDEVESA